jgi:hypothetical protein
MDVTGMRKSLGEFLAVAAEGGFGPPPAGEWDAERLLAHVAAADAAIASVALAVIGGERASYDNRTSLDEWNLHRIVAECGGLSGLTDFVRVQGQLFCSVAAALPESARSVLIPVLIISGDEMVVDEPRSLFDLVEGIGRFHLPMHTQQLAGLRS